MGKKLLFQRKGQSAAIDLMVFLLLSSLAISYLSLQSAQLSSRSQRRMETESLNEMAEISLSALLSSKADIEISVLQKKAASRINSPVTNDARKILDYLKLAEEAISEIESSNDISDNPHIAYIRHKFSEIDSYLGLAQDSLIGFSASQIDSALSDSLAPCQALGELSSIFSSFVGFDFSCDTITSEILSYLGEELSSVAMDSNDLVSFIDEAESLLDVEIKEKARELRCKLSDIRQAIESVFGYIEVGVNPDVSPLELFPVKLNAESYTIRQVTEDALTSGDFFAKTDWERTAIASVALTYFRGKNLTTGLFEKGFLEENIHSQPSGDLIGEYIEITPEHSLQKEDNMTLSGVYTEDKSISLKAKITGAGYLGLQAAFFGKELGSGRQKTVYFEGGEYILNSTAYITNAHERTYNGSAVKGVTRESPISVSEEVFSHKDILTPEINFEGNLIKTTITRPFSSVFWLELGNATFEPQNYAFQIEHIIETKSGEYIINSSVADGEYDPNAEKSAVLGALAIDKTSIFPELKSSIESEIKRIIPNYSYSFNLSCPCKEGIYFGSGSPQGRYGIARRHFWIDDCECDVTLILWRD